MGYLRIMRLKILIKDIKEEMFFGFIIIVLTDAGRFLYNLYSFL